MFTIPWDIRISPSTKGTPITEPSYREWVDGVKEAIDDGWLEIALHGLTHAPREFDNLTYQEAKNRIVTGLKMFESVGIKTNGMFKAPQWLINEDGKKAVKDMNLKLMEDGYYNWNLKDSMPEGEETLIAHGHVQDEVATMNGMDQSLLRLMKTPIDAEWVFLSEVVS